MILQDIVTNFCILLEAMCGNLSPIYHGISIIQNSENNSIIILFITTKNMLDSSAKE